MPRGRQPTHGMSASPTYKAWLAMKVRCAELYGDRNARIHPPWAQSFTSFLADLGERPRTAHHIARIDADGDFAPGNVRWAEHESPSVTRAAAPTMDRTCQQCGHVFAVSEHVLRRGEGLFCSRACATQSRVRRVTLTCPTCGATFTRIPSRVKLAKQLYCSAACRSRSPEHLAFMKDRLPALRKGPA